MKGTVSIRLDEDLEQALDRVCRDSGLSRSEVIRSALRRQLGVLEFDRVRERVLPFAEARGYLTDEDIFRDIS